MPKYIVDFVNPKNLESNKQCELCSHIDYMYANVEKESNVKIQQEMINVLEGYLTDGYGLLRLYESLGIGTSIESKVKEIKTYQNINEGLLSRINKLLNDKNFSVNSNIDYPTILYSKWCKRCGARKKDIYDTSKKISTWQLGFVNFNLRSNANGVSISWGDPDSIAWYRTKLYKKFMDPNVNISDSELCIEYSKVKNIYSYPNEYLDKNVFFNPNDPKPWYYKIYVYDKFGNLLCSSESKEIYI